MPRGRPKKVLSQEEQEKLDSKLRVRNFILRVLSHVNPRDLNWIIESAIVKSWFKNYPNEKFWDEFYLPDFLSKVDSFRPFTSDWGKKYINGKWNLFLLGNQEKQEILLGDKIGADVKITKTKNTLKDFLK